MRRLHLLPLALVLAFIATLGLAAVTDTRPERRLKAALGLPHTCIANSHASPGWRSEAALSERIDEPRAVTVGDDIYLAGGIRKILYPKQAPKGPDAPARVPIESSRDLIRFDPRTGRYVELPDMPMALNHVGLAAYHGDIYVVGGHGNRLAGGDVHNELLRYSPRERRWERLPSMSTARGAAGVGVMAGRLYVAGGLAAGGPIGHAVDTLEAYDFATRRWSVRAPMSHAREHVGAAVGNGRLFIIGGRDRHSDALRYVESYDPATNRWRSEQPLLQAAGGLEATPVPGAILAMGGGNDRERTITDAVQRLDLSSVRWQPAPHMITARHGFAAALADGRVYTFGGSACALFASTSTVESFDVNRR